MSENQLDVFIPVLLLIALAVIMFVGAIWIVGRLIRPENPTDLKNTAYECGELPVGSAWSNFNVRFYVVSLIFIVFDVEGALMFPVAAVFKKFVEIGAGGVVLGSLILFILILVVGLAYCWRKGDLDWVKSFQLSPEQLAELRSGEDNK